MTGALGSTFIAAKYWDTFAVGAALVGFPIVVGENVVGIDQRAVIHNGKIEVAPELDRRINTFLRYYDGYGAIIVQMNVEDTRNGVAEYVIDKYGDKVIIELKWGQGAKDIGGEIQVIEPRLRHLPEAARLRRRSRPDAARGPEGLQERRHQVLRPPQPPGLHRPLSSVAQVESAFKSSVEGLRKLGYKRISLKTGSYGMEALAMAIRYATDCELDLLTIDGSGGGTGMSPWNMMETWGVPSIFLHSKAHEYAKLLQSRGKRVVDLAFAGGLAREDHIFKALALGAPFVKLICMGRAMMIPGFVGANIEGALHPDRKEAVHGNWDSLPPAVMENGLRAEEIFAGYFDVQKKVGADEMANIPLGAIAIWTLCDKLAAGVQQLMAGARRFKLSEISRDDLFAANRETEKETGIRFMTEALDEQAKSILTS